MKVSLISPSPENPEIMGIFGLSWKEKIAAFMIKQLKGKPQEKNLKNFFGAGGKNITLIDNLHREYIALMAQGLAPSDFSIPPDGQGNGGEFSPGTISLASAIARKTNVDAITILEFLRALFVLSRDGKIPYDKWNPQGYQKSTQLKKTFKSEKGILDFASKTGTYGKYILILASVGVGAYLLSQLKELKK